MLHFNLDCPLRTDALSVAACASLDEFVALARANPDNYCATCMRTDFDRYAELRALVEAWQKVMQTESQPDTHTWMFNLLPLRQAQNALRDWSHR